MPPSRRAVLAAGASAVAAPAIAADPAALAGDEAHWGKVAALFDAPPPGVIQLENGQFGAMARSVRAAYEQKIARINRETTLYTRGAVGADLGAVRTRAAALLGVGADEIAFTRGGTESMTTLIGGYNRLKPGDAVLYADLDYDSMQYAMQYLKERRGAEVVKIALPEPASHQGLIDAYAKALDQYPKTRLLLLTHISHRTGLVVPVAEIARMARARGVDVIVDAAHSWGQIEFKVTDLEVDFVGFNLHKWIGAPLGVGFMYIRKDRLSDVSRAFEDGDFPASDVRSRVHTGTTNIANVMTVPDALDLHRAIGAPAKEARLRYLRDLWVQQTRELPNLQVLTPDDPRLHAGITSIRLKGKTTRDDNLKLAARLRDEFGLFTVRRGGVAAGDCVRVSPALFTTAEDVTRLVHALRIIAA